MIILLFGPPGSGKGTQSPLITRLLSIPAISTGEMLRSECDACTPLGMAACDLIAAGRLVGDDIVNPMLVQRISRPDCKKGFLLDGYPRTVDQAKFLDGMLKKDGWSTPTILHLATPISVLVERISARRQCPACGRIYNLLYQPPAKPGVCDIEGAVLERRKDDTPEILQERLDEYEKRTAPVLAHYKDGDYHRIPANRPSSEIYRDIEALLRPRLLGGSRNGPHP